jgi:hypothetical protein
VTRAAAGATLAPGRGRRMPYAGKMGSSGMKRKGRRHLPKAGTRPATEYAVHEHDERALHPFAADPTRRRRTPGATLIALAIVVLVTIGVIALVLVTI